MVELEIQIDRFYIECVDSQDATNRGMNKKIMELSVVYEDSELIVINKIAGLLVLPDRYDSSLKNLSSMLKERSGQIFVVHRIDKETSGIIVFAKNAMTHSTLNQDFQTRSVVKRYLAICVGESRQQKGRIEAPLGPDPMKHGRMRIDLRDGKESITNYEVIEQFVGYTYVETKPETGRTHQIRVHLSSIGLPILGDITYGGGKGFLLSEVKKNYKSSGEERPLLERAALHARSITIQHPTTLLPMTFEADMPKDMEIVLKNLKKLRSRTAITTSQSA
jgi:RluA family pseudouridine synthase